MEKEFHQIYERYHADLYTFILRLCGNEQLAKDILQDTMLRAMTNADRFKGNCTVRTWLCTIARNLYYDHLKKAESRTCLMDTIEETAAEEDIEQSISDAETAMQIHRLLHRLDEPYREVFTLRVFAELKYAEIGSLFGKSENWANVTYFRAKQKLLQMMKKEELL